MRFFAEFTLERSKGLRMTSFDRNKGFTLLEMVIAIFIIAVVLAFSLIAMGKGMGLSAKSSDMAIATAIAEQEMARVKNIPFPPTTVDRPGDFSNRGDTDPPVPLTYFDAYPPYNNDFQVSVSNDSYDAAVIPTLLLDANHDNTMLRKITINVYRKRDNAKLVTLYTYIARNGTI